jgi:hypothetical protein
VIDRGVTGVVGDAICAPTRPNGGPRRKEIEMKALAKPLYATSMPILAGVVLALLVALAIQARPASADGVVNSSFLGGVAIEGTDPVAYFTEGRPVEGSNDYEHQWMDATWRFASSENRDAFAAEPERYAPQYGGWCAWAVAHGYTAKIDPEAWSIIDGRLFLNYSKDVQSQWAEDIPGYVAKGDANWPKLEAELRG